MKAKVQLIASLSVCLVLLVLLVVILLRVDKSDNLQTCESVANQEVRHIPARCLKYYLQYEEPASNPSSS